MGTLTNAALDALLAKGCACGGTKLLFDTYVDARFSLLAGEQYGALEWAYKGETFLDGVFEISCASCKAALFSSDMCPRCNAPDALAIAMETPNTLPIPRACPRCASESLSYTAMLPARTVYEGKRAQKARPTAGMEDDGVHGCRIDCASCGVVAEVTATCPLCAAPGPLRARPD